MRFLQILTMIYPVFIARKNWTEQVVRPSQQAAASHLKILNILGNFLPHNNNRQKITKPAKKQVLKLWVYDCFNLSTHVKSRRIFYNNFRVVKQLEVIIDDDLVFTQKTASNRTDKTR